MTPSYRIENLKKKSINFEYIDEWIIVYDGNKIKSNPCGFEDNKKLKSKYVNVIVYQVTGKEILC
jgi:hypothetical protein